MAERTFTEEQFNTLLEATVEREVAAANEKIAALEQANADLQEKVATTVTDTDKVKQDLTQRVDTLEAEKLAAQADRDRIQAEFDQFKADATAKEQAAARRDARVAEMREAAKGLKDDYFTAERADRWAQLDDEAFSAHKAELAAIAGALTPAGDDTKPPRETAMAGQTPKPKDSEQPSALSRLLFGAPTPAREV